MQEGKKRVDFEGWARFGGKISRWQELFVKYCTESVLGTRSQVLLSYLGPSFSSILGPCSCHSCLDIHISSLSAICRRLEAERTCALGIPRLTYNICKDCATEEDHMSPPRRILDSDSKFLEVRVSVVVLYVILGDSHSASQGSHPVPLSATAA